MAPLASLLLLATPLVAFADVATMSVLHPGADSSHAPFFWDRRQAKAISMSDVAHSSLRLMGTAPLSTSSAKELPSADVVSPPQAVLLLAVDSVTAATMPMLQDFTNAGVNVNIRQSNQGFDIVVDQLSTAMSLLDLNWHTHCASSSEFVSDSLPCTEASTVSSLGEGALSAIREKDNSWTLKQGSKVTSFVSDNEKSILEELAAIKSMASKHTEQSFYIATLSGISDLTKSEDIGALADAVLVQVFTELNKAHNGALVVQVVELDQHRLLSSSALSPTMTPTIPGNYTGTELTIQEISTYQICLWTGIGLALALLSAICCMVNMDIRPDSLLYAKFQADVSSKVE